MFLLRNLTPCPLCGQRPTDIKGCCQACTETLFAPSVNAKTVTLGPYQGQLKAAVRAFKYRQATRLGTLFAERLTEVVTHNGWRLDVICPVPLHRSRQRTRGYNQAALLGKHLAKSLQLPYRELLKRSVPTQPQAGLDASARSHNVRGAFQYASLQGARVDSFSNVLLVDDVLTTGATTQACEAVLQDAGVTHVFLAVIARAE